jgi:hypothetical protein
MGVRTVVERRLLMSLKPGIPAFDYQEFSSLTTADLVAYLEPIVTNPSAVVPSAVEAGKASADARDIVELLQRKQSTGT